MKNSKNTWALITGASSGLGQDFAHLLAERGTNLVLVARRGKELEELAALLRSKFKISVHVEAMDLSVRGAGSTLKARLDQVGIQVDTLLNNAGYGLFGEFLERPLSSTLDMLQLNMITLTELTHVFAADMVGRGGGRILLVASIGAYQATPLYAAYSASKAYVLLFGEALHEELRSKGVTVSVLAPGITATSFLAVSGQKPTLYQRLAMMQSRVVARMGLAALESGRASLVPGFMNAVTAWSNRLMPRFMQRKVAYLLMRN